MGVAHVHEGLELADASGFIAVGETSDENNYGAILVTRVDTEGNKVWSKTFGTQLSAAHTVVESGSNVIVGGGLYKASTGKMQATLMALDSATGSTVWTTSLDHSGFGAIRGVILDAGSLVATGYVDNNEGGFLFIADGDNAKAMAWKFDLSGNLQTTTALGVDGMQQGAKIRADPVNGGYAIAGSVWMSDQQGIVVKLNSDLSVAWSQDYGLNTGADQIFDLVVDSDGNYLLGGHTTAGTTNWDCHSIQGFCIPDHIHHIHHSCDHIHIHHIHHSSRNQHQTWAQPRPHACHSIQGICIPDHIHHIHHSYDHIHIHHIHHSSRDQHQT